MRRPMLITALSRLGPVVLGVFLLAPGSARATGAPPESGPTAERFVERAFAAGTAASARVFVAPDSQNTSQGDDDDPVVRGVSKGVFLLGAGMVASAIVVAAWLLRPPAPCRAPLELSWSTRSWQQLREHLADPERVPFPAATPPPAVFPAEAGCFFAE